MTQEKKSERFILSIEPSLLSAIDEWRAKKPGLPSRARAVRTLVTNGLVMDVHREKVEEALKKLVSALHKSETDPGAKKALEDLLGAKTKTERHASWNAYRAVRDLGA